MNQLPDYVIDRILFEPNTGHWFWMGYRHSGYPYGVLSIHGLKSLAHRYIYQQLVGPIPAGLELDHLCRIPYCVNPAHLEPVTHRVNMERGAQALKTHCPQGHPYDTVNTAYYQGSRRRCRTCLTHRCRARYRKVTNEQALITPDVIICISCGERRAGTRGRCQRCYRYWQRHDIDRPQGTDAQGRPLVQVAGHASLKRPLQPCVLCSGLGRLIHGLCNRCDHRYRRGQLTEAELMERRQ